jgi:nitrile hydratase accessory protein
MTDALVSSMDLPRSNGELVFEAPWQSRAFGLAVALHESGAYSWTDFSRELAAQIADAPDDDGAAYYERWFAALAGLLGERGLITDDEIAARAEEIAAEDAHDH